MKNLVVGIGEALWDILPDGKKIGGAPANFAYHISQFGLEGVAVSAIGHDALGQEISKALTSKGLRLYLEVVDYSTGTVLVELDEKGVPKYDIRRNAAWDKIPFTSKLRQLAQNTKAVCFGSLAQRDKTTRATISSFIDEMPKDDDSLIVFDANLRQDFYSKEILCNSIDRCNILKINDDELDVIKHLLDYSDSDTEQASLRILESFNLKSLILTCGVDGSYVFTHDLVSFLPTPKVKVADTVGAGDSFTAAYVASILKGATVAEAHQRAVETSAYVCTQHGAMPVLPAKIVDFSYSHEE